MGQVGVYFQIQLAFEAVELGAPWRRVFWGVEEARGKPRSNILKPGERPAASNPAKCANFHLIFCRTLIQSSSG